MLLQPDTLSRLRRSDMFGYKIQNTVYMSYESFHVVLFIFIGINFRGLAKSEIFADIFICGFDTCKLLFLLSMPFVVQKNFVV